MSKGFTDKLYWRPDGSRMPLWHCLKKARDEDGRKHYLSLCGRYSLGAGCLGGQDIRRPAPYQRCGVCDGREMERRMWDFSGPTTHPKGDKG